MDSYPKSLDEAVSVLVEKLKSSEKAKIAVMDDDSLLSLHHTIGMWIRNEFGLWSGNHELLNECSGIKRPIGSLVNGYHPAPVHPDEASYVILCALRDRLVYRG